MLGSRPTLEQVREHAERHPHQHEFGGLWRYHDGYLPRFCMLSVKHGDVYTNVLSGPRVLLDTWLCTHVANNWTPCDQAGNPLPLASALAETQRLLDVAEAGWHMEMSQVMELRARAEQAEQERDKLRHELAVVEEEFGIITGHGPEALREAIREWSQSDDE